MTKLESIKKKLKSTNIKHLGNPPNPGPKLFRMCYHIDMLTYLRKRLSYKQLGLGLGLGLTLTLGLGLGLTLTLNNTYAVFYQ